MGPGLWVCGNGILALKLFSFGKWGLWGGFISTSTLDNG